MSAAHVRAARGWGVVWAVVYSGVVGFAAAWTLERWPAARKVPLSRRLGAALGWGALWTLLTRSWWCRAFYQAAAALVGWASWPRAGVFALLAGWVFWTLFLWWGLPLARRWLRLPGDPVPEPPLPAEVTVPPVRLADGTDLGLNGAGRPVALTDREANTHVLVCGASGSGKSNLLLVIAASVLRRGLPLIFVDGKGSGDLRRRLEALAAATGRTLTVWSVTGPTHYNPLRHGGPTELRDKVTNAEQWSDMHYRRAAEHYLGEVFGCLKATGREPTLPGLSGLLIPAALRELAREMTNLAEGRRVDTYLANLDESSRSAILGLANRVGTLVRSEAGPWLTPGTPEVDLLDVAENGGACLFSLDSLRFPGLVSQIGSLLMVDIRTVASRLIERGNARPYYVIIDEFNVFDGPQVLALLNKGREAGLCCVLATQDLSDVAIAGGSFFVDQVLANTNVKILLRQDVDTSAQRFSASVGNRRVWRATHVTDGGVPTGHGSMRQVEEPILDPNLLKRLSPHEAVLVRKAPTWAVERVRLRKAQ